MVEGLLDYWRMDGREQLGERLGDYLAQRNWAARRFAIKARVSENTVRRILETASYRPEEETWRKIARAADWDVAETLRLAGYPPSEDSGASATEPADPIAVIEQQLRRLFLDKDDREALMVVLRHFVRGRGDSQAEPC